MFDEYMQNMLGENYFPYQYTYEPMSRNTYFNNQLQDYDQYNLGSNFNYNYSCTCDYPYNCNQNFYSRNIVQDIENMYPEIYNIIYPMIQKACMQNNKPVTEDVLEEMTNDIYSNIEADNIFNLNITVENRSENNSVNKSTNKYENTILNSSKNSSSENKENREYRQDNNPIRDLIRILLIREFLGERPSSRPPRPPRPPFPPTPGPFPPRPPRPPMPGNPPRPPRQRF